LAPFTAAVPRSGPLGLMSSFSLATGASGDTAKPDDRLTRGPAPSLP
jgi:hypothetical protein